ncbi:MAG: hypothetical protein GVY11_00345 [Gammaproteobacteria bacterium]|jgi:hypothetical protein|nr:hypothetical protein [Gammaproteobacteria bacterium]
MTTRLYSGAEPSTAVQIERVPERVTLDVPARASLNIRSEFGKGRLGTAPAFLHLGDLISGGRARAFLTLDGNIPVTLSVVATNGVLIHTEFPQYTAPYSLALGSAQGAGTSDYEIRLEPGDTVVLEVSVGELERLVAGDYQDILQLTMTAD